MKLKISQLVIICSVILITISTMNSLFLKRGDKKEKYTNLINFANQNGANNGKFDIKYLTGNNRFVVATEDLNEKDNISTIPFKLVLSDENPLIKPTCTQYSLSDQRCIAVYVCNELKNPETFFRAFYDYLPYDYNTYPTFYTGEHLSLIKGSVIMDKVSEWKKWISQEYKELKKYNVKFSQKDYAQCRIIVWSRNFSIRYNERDISFVVPVSDLFNYNGDKINVKWFYDAASDAFKIEASKEIKKDEEIFVNYGQKSNVNYLFFYGFTIPNNPTPMSYDFNYNSEKISLAMPVELSHAIPSYRQGASPQMANVKDEVEGLSLLKTHLLKYLNVFKTKLEQDKAELEKPETKKNFNLFNIYNVLVEEKTLLTSYIQAIDDIKAALESDKDEVKGKLNEINEKKISPEYIQTLLAFEY